MSAVPRCSACGAELLQDASPQGLCASCLLKLGLSSTNIPVSESELPPRPEPAPGMDRSRSTRRWRISLALAVIFGAVAALAFVLFHDWRRSRPKPNVVRFTLSLPHPTDFALSPDGRRLVFTGENNERKRQLWIHLLDSFIDIPLAETEDAAAPFWSPDSRFVGFFARGKLRKIDVANGVSEVLCDAPTGKSGAWGSQGGVIVFAREASGVLYRVSERGGTPEPVTKIDGADRLEISHRWPHFLADGRHFIYTATATSGDKEGVFIASVDSPETVRIMSGHSAVAHEEQSLLFVRNGLLLIQSFNPRSLRTEGDPRPLRFAEHVDRFSVSTNGVLAYQQSEQIPPPPLAWFDRSGKNIGIIENLARAGHFSLSPNGRLIAVSRLGDLWLYDLGRSVMSRFTFDRAEDTFPIWSPDGTRIVFLSNRNGRRSIYQKLANAGTNEELLWTAPQLESIESWSPEGRFIVYTSRDEKGKSVAWVLPLMGDRKPFVIPSAFNLSQLRFSPDGRWVTYVSDESGKDEVYVETFPPGVAKFQVSVDGGAAPRWSGDGREIFYRSPEKTLMAVEVRTTGESMEMSVPHGLFRIGQDSYEVSPDGRRFLLTSSPAEEQRSSPVDIVINWPSEL